MYFGNIHELKSGRDTAKFSLTYTVSNIYLIAFCYKQHYFIMQQ